MLDTRTIFLTVMAGVGAYLLFTSNKIRNVSLNAFETARVRAFLYVIRYAEGTLSPNGYRTLYGGALWGGSAANHPASNGWRGVTLASALCSAAGLNVGCVSTAAGAYQFILPTWLRLAGKLSLPDFSAASQDRAALELIAEAGALEDVKSGNFEVAITKVRKIWASMPGAGYAQPEKSMSALARVYQSALSLFS